MTIRTPILGQLYARAILPALAALDLDSAAARTLVLGTFAHESGGGAYIAQYPAGPALGFAQIEPQTAADTLRAVMAKSPRRYAVLQNMQAGEDATAQIAINALYAAALCRLIYWIRPEPLPAAADLPGIGSYWKAYYNTPAGGGTVAEFLSSFTRFVGAVPA